MRGDCLKNAAGCGSSISLRNDQTWSGRCRDRCQVIPRFGDSLRRSIDPGCHAGRRVWVNDQQAHYRITDGSQSTMAGKTLTRISATSIAPMNHTIDGMILAIDILAIAQVIKTTDATGGVC